MTPSRSLRGFTLVELIVTIGVIAILVSAVFAAIDPVKRINASRNVVRREETRAIASSLVSRLAAGRQIDGLDTDAASWQMIGIGDACDVDMCPGDGGVVSAFSLALNGVNDHVQASSLSFPSAFSVSLWAKFTELGENPILSTVQTEGGAGFLFSLTDSRVRLSLSDGSSAVSIASDPLSLSSFYDDFHHVAFTYDASSEERARIFLDGTEVGNGAGEGLPVLPPANTLLFGASPKAGEDFTYLNGRLDDIRIFNGALQPDAIADLAFGLPLEENLLSYWPIEELGSPVNPLTETVAGAHATHVGEPAVDNGSIPSNLNGRGIAIVKSECLDLSNGDPEKLPRDPLTEEGDTRSFYIVNRVGGSVVVRACLAEGEEFGGGGNPPLIEAAR